MNIYTIGGYSEVGKNMTAIQTKEGNDVFVFDIGLHLPPIVELEERDKFMSEKRLRTIGAIPQDIILDRLGLRSKVRAIMIGHAHLDHVGAVPYVAGRYPAKVFGTPFTTNVLKSIIRDENVRFTNDIKPVQPNSSYKVKGKKDHEIEFINITHSAPQSTMMAVHTDEGTVLYANDFKLDDYPQLGKKPNYERLKQLGKQGVKALVVESLYSGKHGKTPSEKIAKGLLEDVLLTVNNKNAGIIVTTFSSHIARLKSIVEISKKLNRKIVFLGRSLNKYVTAAIEATICPFTNDIKLVSYKRQVDSVLKAINSNRGKYVLVCTGHQGEPGSILERISRNQTPLRLSANDNVIFSSSTIPTDINIDNKTQLENRLRKKGVRIFNDVHVSGHAAREDLRDFINMINPEHLIPAHGDIEKLNNLGELGKEMGYRIGRTCHISRDLGKIKI